MTSTPEPPAPERLAGEERAPSVTWLERVMPPAPVDIAPVGQHPSRQALARALDGDSAAEGELRGIYEAQAADWRAWTETRTGYTQALIRGLNLVRDDRGVWLEICSGTGEGTIDAVALHRRLVVLDASWAMLAQADGGGTRIAGDVVHLPIRTGSIALVFGLNAVPLVADVRRVLDSRGVLLLAYSFGPLTPLYASPERILNDLGNDWSARCARGVWGEYQLFARAIETESEGTDT